MAGNKYTLGAEIQVTGNYKRNLKEFLDSIKKCERDFKNMADSVIYNSSRINSSLKQLSEKMTTYVNRVALAEEKIVKVADNSQERISKNIEKLKGKYDELGASIKSAYSEVPKGFGMQKMPRGTKSSIKKSDNWNPNLTKREKEMESVYRVRYEELLKKLPVDEYGISKRRYNSFQDSDTSGWDIGAGATLKSFAVKFFAIQTTIKGIEFLIRKSNDIANRISGGIIDIAQNILKVTGLNPTEMLNNAMDFESIRKTMDVLAKSTENGEKVYSMATKLAKNTSFTEKDTTSMATYVLKAGLMPTAKDLEQVGNLASLKPELGAEHAGFAIFDWLNGLQTSLKRNYGIDNETLRNYMKTLSDKGSYSKAFTKKGKVNDKEQAFNLLMRYLEDNYNDLALTQSNTLRGKFSTVTGQLEQYGSDLMGLESKNGEIKSGNSVVNAIKAFLGEYTRNEQTGELEATSGLMKTLDDLASSNAFNNLADTIGRVAKSILDVVNVGTNLDNLETFLDMLSNIGEGFKSVIDKFKDMNIMQQIIDVIVDAGNRFADMLKSFSESKEYESFLEKLPNLIKQSLDYEMAKMNFALTIASHANILTGLMDKVTKFINFATYQMQGGAKEEGRQYKVLTGQEYADGLDFFKKTTGDQTVDFSVGDKALTNWLESEGTNYMSEDERDNLKNYINNDYKNNYDIKLEYHNGKYDRQQLVEDLLKLLDEADSNNN